VITQVKHRTRRSRQGGPRVLRKYVREQYGPDHKTKHSDAVLRESAANPERALVERELLDEEIVVGILLLLGYPGEGALVQEAPHVAGACTQITSSRPFCDGC
jgi:hypothetical protein